MRAPLRLLLGASLALLASTLIIALSPRIKPLAADKATITPGAINQNNCFHSRLDLTGANLAHQVFHVCVFEKTRLVNLRGASSEWVGVSFSHVNLGRANLQRSSFRGSWIENSSFAQADLRGAKFQSANVARCDFTGADLRGVKIENSNFTLNKLRGARFNADTELPFDRTEAERRGMLYVE